MPRSKLSNLKNRKQKFKYHINDVTKTLRGKTVNVNCWVEFDPIVGWINRVNLTSTNWPLSSTPSPSDSAANYYHFKILQIFLGGGKIYLFGVGFSFEIYFLSDFGVIYLHNHFSNYF